MESVNLIASGYEFDCPKCGELNKVIEYTDFVTCEDCKEIFIAEEPMHAIG